MAEFAKKVDNYDYDCNKTPSVGYQDVCVCLPVTITPTAKVRDVRVSRVGKPEILDCDSPCKAETSCKFTISQKFRIAVPVEFDAKACPGETYIDCDCDCGCDYDDCNDDW